MTSKREQNNRDRLMDSISIHEISENQVSILCPKKIAERLHEYLRAEGGNPSRPKDAIMGTYTDAEILVDGKEIDIKRLISIFVETTPYEEDL